MKRFFCYMMLFLASCIYHATAQTSYYALTKIDEYGKVNSKCSGGQFVKVSKNMCFDADSRGNDVGNGRLYRDVNNNTREHIYIGTCFYNGSVVLS